MGLFTKKLARYANQEQTIEEEVISSNIDENSSLTPKFYKNGEDVTNKIITKAHFGKIKISKINKDLYDSN
jgi:hypothetical protein